MKVSIVLPAYNERRLIAGSVRAVDASLAGLGREYEVIVGDDGSVDGTADAVRRLDLERVRVIREPHRGKGAILTRCLLASRGEYAGFLDADLEIDASYLPRFVEALDAGFDAAIASKTLDPASRERPLSRRITTGGYNFLVRGLFGSPISDHQAGLKLFRGDYLRSILPAIRSEGWLWDTEILLRLLRDGKRVEEIPVTARPVRDGHVAMVATSLQMLRGLLRLYVRKRRRWA